MLFLLRSGILQLLANGGLESESGVVDLYDVHYSNVLQRYVTVQYQEQNVL